MPLYEILKAVAYGIIEGITEWLPISSTGHMILAELVLKFQLSDAFMEMFRVVIQLGAILAVVVLYWGKLWPFKLTQTVEPAQGEAIGDPAAHWLADHIRWPVMHLWFKILAATLPALVLGLLLDDWMDEHLYNYFVVSIMLIVYGVGFLWVERKPRPVRLTKLSRFTYKDALLMGCFQVLAMVPGTSRSGATILGAILIGISRPLAAQFSFFMAIPVMFGASILKIAKFVIQGNALDGVEITVLFTGSLVAFLVSLVCIRFLMNYVRNHSFKVFGWYRIVLGVAVLVTGVVLAALGQPIT